MTHRIRKVLSFSNVIACLALFIALGGSVYAAGKISGTQIKANSIPGNRVKAKTLTGKQIKPGSLTGTQIKAGSLTGAQIQAGSLTGAQIQAGSLTGTQINASTLSGVTASKLSSIQYAVSSVPLGSGSGDSATATCPAGTNIVGGGATVSSDILAIVNDSGPNGSRNGWTATGFGEPGTSMTVTAICTAAATIAG
jgi:hypothetical protein